MFAQLRTAAVVFVGLTVVTGVAYPLLITVIAQTAFHRQANGSLVEVDGRSVGSELVAQGFTGAAYFWSRPRQPGTMAPPRPAATLALPIQRNWTR
jgi:K+-transporting ATPase ATPase C chain